MSVGKLIVKDFGQTLGIDKGSFVIKENGKQVEKVPFWKINEIVVASRNAISVDALLWASLYNVDVVFTMHNGKPLSFLNSIKDKGNVEIRLNQLHAYESSKGVEIAKTILLQKISNENALLKMFNLKSYEGAPKLPSLDKIKNANAEKMTQSLRLEFNKLEERYAHHFYSQIFPMFPKWLQTNNRKARNATDPLNNLLNLSYEILEWKILKAVVKSKLEPNLGFLHSLQVSKPSLTCDLMEPFRPYIFHFLLSYVKELKAKDFERAYVKDKYPRYFLKHEAAWRLIENINKELFEAYIPMQRNRKHGSKMQFETFLDEYVSNVAKYINTTKSHMPSVAFPQYAFFSTHQSIRQFGCRQAICMQVLIHF